MEAMATQCKYMINLEDKFKDIDDQLEPIFKRITMELRMAYLEGKSDGLDALESSSNDDFDSQKPEEAGSEEEDFIK